ncbi:hypothetical protein MMC29_005645, partial [Sticta canariensis]|nr:hypothetical protein [Sticta canariensis]
MAFQAMAVFNDTSDVASNNRSTTVKWNNADTKQIISWLSERDGEGVRYNLDEWNKRNKQHAAKKMLRVTGLISKAGVDKKKIAINSK